MNQNIRFLKLTVVMQLMRPRSMLGPWDPCKLRLAGQTRTRAVRHILFATPNSRGANWLRVIDDEHPPPHERGGRYKNQKNKRVLYE